MQLANAFEPSTLSYLERAHNRQLRRDQYLIEFCFRNARINRISVLASLMLPVTNDRLRRVALSSKLFLLMKYRTTKGLPEFFRRYFRLYKNK